MFNIFNFFGKKAKKVDIELDLPVETIYLVTELAKTLHMSVDDFIGLILKEYIENNEEE